MAEAEAETSLDILVLVLARLSLTRTAAPLSTAFPSPSPSCLSLRRRGSHEGEVNPDSLLQQFLAVGAFYRRLRFRKSRVLDQDVAL